MRALVRCILAAVATMAATMAPALAATCEELVSLTIPDTQIVSAVPVPAGPLEGRGRGPALSLPAYCKVLGVTRPVADSEVHFEVWLPSPETWNGKFEGTGNGGYSGALSLNDMAVAVSRGYAAAGSTRATREAI